MPWNPKSAKGNRISFSEATCLAKCEYLWDLQYRNHTDRQPSQKMMLGTLFGIGAATFWLGESWREAVQEATHDEELEPILTDDTYFDAVWLLERYERHYARMRPQVKVVGTELELEARVPYTAIKVMGHLDELWEIDGELWLVERKTYGSRDRLDLVTVEPQESLYAWLARQCGYDIRGVIFDGAYTYRWKRDDRADSESFDMIWMDRTPAQCDAALDWLRATISRRTALRRGAKPMRNIGPLCKGCAGKERCFEALAFPQELQIVSPSDQAA